MHPGVVQFVSSAPFRGLSRICTRVILPRMWEDLETEEYLTVEVKDPVTRNSDGEKYGRGAYKDVPSMWSHGRYYSTQEKQETQA